MRKVDSLVRLKYITHGACCNIGTALYRVVSTFKILTIQFLARLRGIKCFDGDQFLGCL